MMTNNFFRQSWAEQEKNSRTGIAKRILYALARPVLSAINSRTLSRETLKQFNPALVIGPRGMPLETRRKWAVKRTGIRNAVVLVQGTGTGWDVITWAKLRPKRIIASDLFDFTESWRQIKDYCMRKFAVPVDFHQAALEDHAFISDGAIDLCVSDAVFEHCKNLGEVMRESFRVLRPGGSLYATYGPLWYCAGGDHFSGRGGLNNAFNHILLDPESYRTYFTKNLQQDEDYQSGGRYVELDLFSKLTTKQYLEIFLTTGFIIDELILEVCHCAVRFKKQYPNYFSQLAAMYPQCTPDDFLIKANFVRLVKPRQTVSISRGPIVDD
jgi:SAM-dependent methyltransferase